MERRRLLALGGASLGSLLAGCGADDSQGTGSSPTSNGVQVSVTGRMDQPDVPIAYGVEMIESVATATRPARIRVTIENTRDAPVVLGEERDVQFHHVPSTEATLYLHPAGEEAYTGPVEPGCWRMTEPVAVPEYYGTITIDGGETARAESLVYGHPDLPEGECLPAGEHRVRTDGVAGDDPEAAEGETDGSEFTWGFTLRVG